ncbi:MAG: gfo/Idh/MocA family oxidoreductase [Chloroflexi bacterium]|nr:gfo/Idh/MocA family oxidoreductase [Chloroflexota bacterium]
MRTAVIGASFAKAAYLPALKTIEDVEIVAIASAHLSSAQATAKAFDIPHAYDNWEQMLAAHPVDLVCIATPTIYHAPMVLKALGAGAHVLCEKPMAMNRDEARAMLDEAEALGRVHLIGHELRFNPNRRKIHQMIADGTLGEIRHVNVWNIASSYGDPASRVKDDWWSLAEMGGGRLGANGSHQIDLLRFWLGEMGAVSGYVTTVVPNRIDKKTGEAWVATADDLVSFSAEMASGALATVFMSGVARHNLDNTAQIFGSKGTLLLSNKDETLWYARPGEPFADISETDPNASLPGINAGIWNVSVVGMMGELTDAIREGRAVNEGATFFDGWRCQVIMDAIKQSSAERRWIGV